MNYDKRWTRWSEFLESSSRASDSDGLEYKKTQQSKHLAISMTHYYIKGWSGWRDYFEKAKK
ncbi:hypothetical protein [Vibrio splendidus]|uniref:Uncharacterized protein n=1 Tax=Vibrio lentus TaxID=136468 RepID=A0A855ILX4_9VIBR|nr:hypothetical protein BCT50_10975 [Vibrio lentus]